MDDLQSVFSGFSSCAREEEVTMLIREQTINAGRAAKESKELRRRVKKLETLLEQMSAEMESFRECVRGIEDSKLEALKRCEDLEMEIQTMRDEQMATRRFHSRLKAACTGRGRGNLRR